MSWLSQPVWLRSSQLSFWFVWLPNYRPGLRPGEQYGIDVSHHQGRIDWTRVAGDDISFAYIKATEGSDFIDPRFRQNWRAAQEAGLARGAYHFFTLCSPGDIQAQNFLETVPHHPEALPPAVDLELAGNCAVRPHRGQLMQELRSFLRLVESANGKRAVLYVGDDFNAAYRVTDSVRRPLWQLRFLRRPDIGGWVIWQVMGFARVDGVRGSVDLDVMRGPR